MSDGTLYGAVKALYRSRSRALGLGHRPCPQDRLLRRPDDRPCPYFRPGVEATGPG